MSRTWLKPQLHNLLPVLLSKTFQKNYNSTGSYSITLPLAISGCIFFNWIKNDCLKEICKTSANSSFACIGLRKKSFQMSADRKRVTVLCDDINCLKAKDLEAVIWKKAVRSKQKEEGESLNKMSCCSVI